METILRKYSDSMGNTIISSQEFPAVKVIFNGKNNTLKLSNSTYISKGTISFTGNNAKLESVRILLLNLVMPLRLKKMHLSLPLKVYRS